jgi:hypothetical protein
MRRAVAWLLGSSLALGACLPATAADVTIYRCTDANGRLTLRDTPCAKGQAQETRNMLRPKDGVPAPVAPRPAARAERDPEYAPTQHLVVINSPRPLYECVTPDNVVYTSDSPEGNPRWVPLWTLGYPVGLPTNPGYPVPRGMTMGGGGITIARTPTYPPVYTAATYGAGTWIRDICHVLPPEEVCARLIDRRDEIRRRFFNAQPSERDVLRLEERGLNARLETDCGNY